MIFLDSKMSETFDIRGRICEARVFKGHSFLACTDYVHEDL